MISLLTEAGFSKGIMLCEQRCECSHLKLILSIITTQHEQEACDALNNIHPTALLRSCSLSDEEYLSP